MEIVSFKSYSFLQQNFKFQVMFFLFVLWMAVIIMNLLIGLTISSIEHLNERAEKLGVIDRLLEIMEYTNVRSRFFKKPESIKEIFEKNKSPSWKVLCFLYFQIAFFIFKIPAFFWKGPFKFNNYINRFLTIFDTHLHLIDRNRHMGNHPPSST